MNGNGFTDVKQLVKTLKIYYRVSISKWIYYDYIKFRGKKGFNRLPVNNP